MAKVNLENRTLTTTGIGDEIRFEISNKAGDNAHLMRIMRDQLYTDNILAVLREYGANARDANAEAGNEDIPIKVNLPTALTPTLKIRDNGPGLSEEGIRVYVSYGSSTKRDTNEQVGTLGIGSKAAFSYTSSFNITSWHKGMKRVYNAALDELDEGILCLLYEDECDIGITGVEIAIPVKQADHRAFLLKAGHVFKYMSANVKFNLPDVISDRLDDVTFKGTKAELLRRANNNEAVMGGISYKVSSEEITSVMNTNDYDFGWYSRFRFFFDIGEVDFTANREELKYTPRTRAALKKTISTLYTDLLAKLHKVKNSQCSSWEKKIFYYKFCNAGIKLPFNFKPKSFICKRAKTFNGKRALLPPKKQTQIIIIDTRKALKGYMIPSGAVTLRPATGCTADDVFAELESLVAEQGCEGIPISRISSLPWTGKDVPKKVPNSKHGHRAFRLMPQAVYSLQSENWIPRVSLQADTDVYFLLCRFVPHEMKNYLDIIDKDKKVAAKLGIDFPKIYGYKSTEKSPVKPGTVKGISYSAWRATFYEEIQKHPLVIDELRNIAWKNHRISSTWRYTNATSLLLKSTKSILPAEHILSRYLNAATKGISWKWTNFQYLLSQCKGIVYPTEHEDYLALLSADYPLLMKCFGEVNEGTITDWVDYILLKDAAKAA